jgi:alkanesulfonate monooxygenase SsuD/methylene tetrahydromethanopterin reductase-like flavin-dependent oxidoreductase (luciferase family)
MTAQSRTRVESTTKPGVGLLLPTFGEQADGERVFRAARLAERYGFHSLWVRDHLFIPAELAHGGVRESGFHLEAMTALTAVAAVTERVKLGTAVLIPLRHPLLLAQTLGTIAHLCSEDRLILGLGTGAFVEEFFALGLSRNRRRLLAESLEILRSLKPGEIASFSGQHYAFEDVLLDPTVPPGMPIWFGGSGTPSSLERAFEGYDGWMGLAPPDALDELLASVDDLAERYGGRITLSTIPPTSVAPTHEQALSRINQEAMLQSMRKAQKRGYARFDDVAGALVLGTPEEAAQQLLTFGEKGMDVVVLDLRVVGPEFDDVLALIGEEVMPLLTERVPQGAGG